MTTSTRSKRPRRRSDLRVAGLFLLPLVVMYLVYYVYSFFVLAQTSTSRVGISMRNPVDVGLENFQNLFADGVFLRSILNNFIFGVVSIVVALTIGFLIAVCLATGVRAKKLFYLVFLLPALIPVSLVATVFGSMFQERFGIVNETLRGIGLGALAQPWLTEPGWAFAVVACLFAYLIGLPIMYYTADLAALPTESLEAALLDGAGTFRIMRSIVYPMMGATHLTVILSLLLGSFRALEQVLFSTGGGPGGVTEITGSYLYSYTNSGGQTIGFVSAASIVVLIIALLISVVQMIVDRRSRRAR